MESDVRVNPHWNCGGRVALHIILVIVFMGLCFCSNSRDFLYLAAYIPLILTLPFLAMAIIVISLTFTFTHETGKNLHLLSSLAIAVFLFITSIVVWKRDFEYGYTASYDGSVILCLSVCVGFATGAAWLIRRQRKTISMRQLAGCTLFISFVLAASQQILRFDKMPSYQLEIGAAQELERAGIQVSWDNWSVTGIAIGNAGIQDKQLERISEFPNLQSLSLEGNPITDGTLASISNAGQLHALYLTNTKISDDGMEHLANAVKLEQLWLGGTEVTDNGLVNLEKLAALGYVDLSRTNISDVGLKKLAHLKRMYYLHLPGTKVTKSGMDSLGETLPRCTIYGTPDGMPYTVN